MYIYISSSSTGVTTSLFNDSSHHLALPSSRLRIPHIPLIRSVHLLLGLPLDHISNCIYSTISCKILCCFIFTCVPVRLPFRSVV